MFAIRRREFIALLGSATTWPIAARGQQRERMRWIGVLIGGLAADDPAWQARGNGFVQGLQELGWSVGRNVRIDYRWGLGDVTRRRKGAEELVAMQPLNQFALNPPVHCSAARGVCASSSEKVIEVGFPHQDFNLIVRQRHFDCLILSFCKSPFGRIRTRNPRMSQRFHSARFWNRSSRR